MKESRYRYEEGLNDRRGASFSLSEVASLFTLLLLVELLFNFLRPPFVDFVVAVLGEAKRSSASLWSLFLSRCAGLLVIRVSFLQLQKRSISCLGFSTESVKTDIIFGLRVSFYLGLVVVAATGAGLLILDIDILKLLFGASPGPIFRTTHYIASYLLVAVLFAPLVEEIVFRGVLYPALRESLPSWAAILTSALLFALAHSGSSGQAGVQFVGGILFASLYEKTGSIVSSSIVHSLGNMAIFAVQTLYL